MHPLYALYYQRPQHAPVHIIKINEGIPFEVDSETEKNELTFQDGLI